MEENILILASDSPRRIELLQKAHIPFKTVSHKFDENSIVEKNHKKMAMKIAYGKASSIASTEKYTNNFVLGVDTIVSYKNKVIGKPKDEKEVKKILSMLSGQKHFVISGISLINRNKKIELINYSLSTVYFDVLSDKFIDRYIESNFWKGLAGGYAIQEIFSLMVKKINGSYSNIVGLPMNVLYFLLKKSNFSTQFF